MKSTLFLTLLFMSTPLLSMNANSIQAQKDKCFRNVKASILTITNHRNNPQSNYLYEEIDNHYENIIVQINATQAGGNNFLFSPAEQANLRLSVNQALKFRDLNLLQH